MSGVKLISYSQSCNNEKTIEDIVAYCARVSNPANQESNSSNEKLLAQIV